MADNLTPPFTGTGQAGLPVKTEDNAGIHTQWVIPGWGPAGTHNRPDVASGKPFPVQLRGSDGTDNSNVLPVVAKQVTISTSITRPANVTTYAANDNLAATSPEAGGQTFTNAARVSGGSGIITDLLVSSAADPAVLLQGELWIYDAAIDTNDADNAAITCSDPDVLKLVAVIPFAMATTVAGSGTSSYAHVQNLSIGFTCVGTANLRFKVKVKNAYVPVSGEVLQFRLKIIQN